MKNLLSLCAIVCLLPLAGCGGGGEDAVTLPTPTGSGFLTGKWEGRLAIANGGGGNSISYSFYSQHWILSHEGATVTMTSYKTDSDGTIVIYGTYQGRIAGNDLIFDDLNDNLAYIHLVISSDHNTLSNHWTPNNQSGGQLTRVIE